MASERRPYRIRLTRAAVKGLRRLPVAHQRRLATTIDSLAAQPRPPGFERISGAGGLLRVRESSYRIVYRVNDRARALLVVLIGHRRDVYRGLP